MGEKLKVLLLRGTHPDQIKILESEVKDFDIELLEQVFLKISSPTEKYFLHLKKYFDFVQIIYNSEFHQKMWEKKYLPENSKSIEKKIYKIKPVSNIGFYSSYDFYRILYKQIIFYKPDVIINLDASVTNPDFFRTLKKEFNFKLVGYHGATPISMDLSVYDFFFSPFMPIVIKAKQYGVKSELIPFGIDRKEIENILRETGEEKKYDIVFSGSLHRAHMSRKILLEKISEEFRDRFHLFTQSDYALTPKLEKVYRGKVFGTDNIKTLALSKIVINHHGDILPWAHNMRLYEATAVGSLLVTDKLPGLKDLFKIGIEVIAYSTFEECIELIKKYLENDEEREKIAKAGQKRTLEEHRYENRLQKLSEQIMMLF